MESSFVGSAKPSTPIIISVDLSGDRPSFSGQSLPNSTVVAEHGSFKYSSFTSTGFFNFTIDPNDRLTQGINVLTVYCFDQSNIYSDQSIFKVIADQVSSTLTYDFSNSTNGITYVLPKSSTLNLILLGGAGDDTYQISKSRIYDLSYLTITDTQGSNKIDVFEDLRSTTNIGISNATDQYVMDPDGSLILKQSWIENGVSKSSTIKMPQALTYLRDHGIDDYYQNNNVDNFDFLFQVWKGSLSNLATNVQGTIGLGTQNTDIMIGSSLKDVIFGGDGNDVLKGGGGNDQIDGGNGLDWALYTGKRNEYSFNVDLSELFDSVANRDGSDKLNNIERIKFSDSVLALDIDGNAGQAYRLYQAALDRTPDQRGLADWINYMDNGGRLKDVSQMFIDSYEFRTKYGALDNYNFINQLYLNVLDRAGEAKGVSDWVGALNSGSWTRAQVLVGFSESTENQANVIGQIKNGIPYVEYWLS